MSKTLDIVLVNPNDVEIGLGEKAEVHRQGWLHRAFSVLLFNDQGEMLLQQRAYGKYHCPGLWTNACCSHPKPGEVVEDAAQRRMQEELNFRTPVEWRFKFEYRAEMVNGLIEHELDHVFSGLAPEELPEPNAEEVQALRWVELDALKQEIAAHPERFTPWFPLILQQWNEKTLPLAANF